LISDVRYPKESQYNEEYSNTNDEYYDDEEETTTKEFLPSSSLGNGDIRSSSNSNKCRHHSRSRRVPPIVLIPQQSQPLSTLTSSPMLTNSRSHYQLFNSNMYLLEKHLKHLIVKQKHEEARNEIINEWKLMALIMDRLLFWLFTLCTVLSTVLCLIIIPFLKNAGYIAALANDLVKEYRSTESMASVIDEQLRANLTRDIID
jgi:low affinity Fe/Cu permease